MAIVTILETCVCDINQNELPYDHSTDAYLVPFEPKEGGITPDLLLRVQLGLNPGSETQIRLTIREKNLADFEFTKGDRKSINYFRQVSNNGMVYLQFQSKNLKYIDQCFLSRLVLTATDSVNPVKPTQNTTRIKGY